MYTYDTLNRLIKALAGQWGQGFLYDGFGNLLQKNVLAGSAPSISLNVDATTNRLVNTGSSPFWYDNNGNMLSGPNIGPLSYDFLNRVVAAPSGVAYSYGASNRRVWKGTASGEAYYLYGLDGENLGTYTPQLFLNPPAQLAFSLASGQERNYFFGKKLFTTEDNVGSAVMALGNQPRSFYPYGEQKSGSTATEQYAFATYWRDGESGLDYAMGRYYSSTDGRFLSPDPYQNNSGLKNPQGWNRYAYVLNDPINYNDPPGLWASGGGGGGGGSPGAPGGGPMSDMGDQFCEQVAFDFGEFDDMTGGSTLPGYLLANHCPGTYLNNGGGGGGGGGGNPMQIVGKAVTAAANLLTKNKNCAGLFLSPTDNTQAGRKDLAQELGTLVPDGNLVVTTDPSASPTNPAWYDDDGIINILSGGSFFTGKINGKSVLTEGQSLSQFQELLIIHEFLHLTGVVGDDNTNQTITFPNGDKVTGSVGVTDEIEKDYNL